MIIALKRPSQFFYLVGSIACLPGARDKITILLHICQGRRRREFLFSTWSDCDLLQSCNEHKE